MTMTETAQTPARVLVNAPKTAKRGDLIEIKTLVSHIMETGFRHDTSGNLVPRNIITRFECRYDGAVIFAADFSPAIAANPFLTFFTVATVSGPIVFSWTGDNGFTATHQAMLTVA
jgi:sulfur-oxidizing protein SoxZ